MKKQDSKEKKVKKEKESERV